VIRRNVRVRGRVQGVFFRESVRRLAGQEAVAGWVRNCDDGSLEAVFEGNPAGVERLVDLCRIGPEGARVDGVEVADQSPEGLANFEVRR
jgi:acylphosphatase